MTSSVKYLTFNYSSKYNSSSVVFPDQGNSFNNLELYFQYKQLLIRIKLLSYVEEHLNKEKQMY